MQEGNSSDTVDSIVEELLLDVKGLMLLNPSDEPLSEVLDSTFVDSNDPDVMRFVSLLQKKEKRSSEGGYFLIAIGEIILAGLLFISGVALISPTILGLGSPAKFLAYFNSISSAISLQALSNPIVPALEFIIALSLLLAAFFTLRMAAESLKETGISRL